MFQQQVPGRSDVCQHKKLKIKIDKIKIITCVVYN
jgi:hypothetical protein